MTSVSSSVLASKAQQSSSASQNIQSSNSNTDQQSSQQRSYSGGGGAGAASNRSQTNPRNIQNSKARHKNHRRPSMQREDIIAEAIAMTSSTTSRKGKTSITHLMDWSVPSPRQQFGNHGHSHSHSYGRVNYGRKVPSWGLGSGYHAVDKARYVNANYRFIVDPTGDYRPQSLDPDSPVPWTSVLQILASSITQTSECPICLCNPVAPRMAKCGHIFCFPCLIRYMAAVDDPPKSGQLQPYHPPANAGKAKWKKCPICYDSVYMNEVRPVKFYQGQELPPPNEGSDVTLRLMMREPGSTLALPKDVANTLLAGSNLNRKGATSDKDAIPWYYTAEVTDFARIMKGTKSYMTDEYEREITDLEEQERVDELMFGDETDWVKKAIGKIRSAIDKVKDLPDKGEDKHDKILGRELYEKHLLARSSEKINDVKQPIPLQESTAEVPDMYHVTSSAQNSFDLTAYTKANVDSKEMEAATATSVPPTIPQQHPPRSPTFQRSLHRSHTAPAHDATQPYYFYQSLPQSYLSPLDIRILKEAFGSFSAFPSTVLPRVENFSTGHIVDDELRKRAKYLSHLPYGCEVNFLECDWTDIVPAEVLQKFHPDLERRRKKKREKDNREERDRLRAERDEDEKRWSAARRRRGGDDDMSVAKELSLHDFTPNSAFEPMPSEDESHDGSLAPSSGPRLGFASLPQSSPPSSRTVWGTPIILSTEAEAEHKPEHPVLQKQDSGWLEDWERNIIALDTAAAAIDISSGGGSKGKKKFKKVTLMTNGGKRGA